METFSLQRISASRADFLFDDVPFSIFSFYDRLISKNDYDRAKLFLKMLDNTISIGFSSRSASTTSTTIEIVM